MHLKCLKFDGGVSTPHVFSGQRFAVMMSCEISKTCQYIFVFFSLIVLSWLYIVKFSKTVPISSRTEIQLNVIDRNSVVSRINLSEMGRRQNEDGAIYKRRIKQHVPKFMLELYESGKNEGRNYTKADVVRSLIPKSADAFYDQKIMQSFGDNHLLIFEVPNADDDEKLLNAELKVLTIVEINSRQLTGVERIVKASIYNDISKNLVHLEELHVYHNNNTWLTFNVTAPVIDLLQSDTNNKTLKIVISISSFLPHYSISSSNHLKLSLMPLSEQYEHDYPVLLLSYVSNIEDNSVKRKKRNVEEDYEEETNNIWDDENVKKSQLRKLKRIRNTCRRKQLYVDFEEINYDEWIVQPKGYEAYQCQGKCFYPVADHLNPTKHAIVQTLIHSVSPSRAPRPCCVPTRLDSISVLYVDDAGVLTYRYAYKDMVVAECGCR